MKYDKISLNQTGAFGRTFLDYLSNSDSLEPFCRRFPNADTLLVDLPTIDDATRQTLVKHLQAQYHTLEVAPDVLRNIDLLALENTYTVTTGHQLCLLTGPSYTIYKIISTIRLAQELSKKNPDRHVVPIFWLASEDHDKEEIDHFSLFGKTHQWLTDQLGAVGRFNTGGLSAWIEEIAPEIPLAWKEAYQQPTLSKAMLALISHLFGKYGLVVLDPDSKDLKQVFAQHIVDELSQVGNTQQLVSQTSEQLEQLGYDTQVHPRSINLFYLNELGRHRIVANDDDTLSLVGQDASKNVEEWISEVNEHPDRFSPNVVLRPLYQQVLLPNIAYVGGPAEIVYWLQLKSLFDSKGVFYPILIPRNFGMIVSKSQKERLVKNEIPITGLFVSIDEWKKSWLSEQSDFSLDEQKEVLNKVFDGVINKTTSIDPSLHGWIAGEKKRMEEAFSNIEKRLKKSVEQKHVATIQQILGIREKLLPNGQLQERSESILNWYINNPAIIDGLMEVFDPLDASLYIIYNE